MRTLIFLLFLAISIPSHASSKIISFYVVKTADYNPEDSEYEIQNKAIILASCYSAADRRMRSGVCTTDVVANGLVLSIDSRGSEYSVCEIREKNEDGRYITIFRKNFLNDADPKNMSNGKYSCGQTYIVKGGR